MDPPFYVHSTAIYAASLSSSIEPHSFSVLHFQCSLVN